MSKHTPVPWRAVPTSVKGSGTSLMDVVSDGAEFSPSHVASEILPEDAEFIVRACNAHDELLEALEICQNYLGGPWTAPEDVIERARAAIAKAKAIEQSASGFQSPR